MFIRALGYYLSSAILVALSIDRYDELNYTSSNLEGGGGRGGGLVITDSCVHHYMSYVLYLLPRYLAVTYPLSILQTSKQRKKAR